MGILAAIGLSVFCLGAKPFVMPVPQPAKTYPARDEHSDEAVTLALDPYDMGDKANIFSVRYNQIGMLPILLVVTNDGDQPVLLAGMKAELVTVDRAKLSPVTPDDIERRLSHPPRRARTGILCPFPPRRPRAGVSQETREEIENAQFGAKAVEPHSTQAGFLFLMFKAYPRHWPAPISISRA